MPSHRLQIRIAAVACALALGACIEDAPQEDPTPAEQGGDTTREEVTEGVEEAPTPAPSQATAGTRTGTGVGLDGWEPMMRDLGGDAADGDATHDIRAVYMVVDAASVLVRYQLAAAMIPGKSADLRFWLEQDGRLLTVEVKTDSQDMSCGLTPAGGATQQLIPSCFVRKDDGIDVAIPRSSLPSFIDPDKDFWISGPQTCCADAERAQPLDELSGSQVAWRAP